MQCREIINYITWSWQLSFFIFYNIIALAKEQPGVNSVMAYLFFQLSKIHNCIKFYTTI